MSEDVSNFEFLRDYQPSLFEYGHSAERYAFSDPQSAIVKLRCFAEQYVAFIYKELRLSTYGANDLFEKIENSAFSTAVERCVVEKLHLIRMKGNRAAHSGKVNTQDAIDLVKEAYFLGAWIFIAYHRGSPEQLPKYHLPEPMSAPADSSQKAESLKNAEHELSKLQCQLEQAQRRIEELAQEVDEVKIASLQRGGDLAMSSFDFEIENTLNKIHIEDVFAQYELTDGQAELIKRLDSFLTSVGQSVFLLKGYAGTGKTFITKGLTEYFRIIRRNYILSAPTGKAAKVIENKTGSRAYTIHKSIYSFKDIAEYRDCDIDGTETYKFYAKLAVNEQSVDTVYIVDESSMVSDIYSEAEFFRFGSGHLLRDFLKFVNLDHNDHRKKVIFIGDDAQLPPVGMNFSPALSPEYLLKEYGLKSESYELQEVVRQKANSGILSNAYKLRQALQANIFNQLDIDIKHQDVNHVDYHDFLPEYLKSCDGKINAKSIFIAHSNADVAAYNRRIREHFFPDQPKIAPGDKVMAVTNSSFYGLFISNGDFGLVRQVLGATETRHIKLRRKSKESNKVEETQVTLDFRDIEVGFKDVDGKSHWFRAKIVENLLYSDAPNLYSDENKALYLDFCIRNPELQRKSLEFKEELQRDPYFNALKLKFGYAITCHKAQGSEWQNVFVKCKSHQNQLSAEYFRWLYTAMTRSSETLYLLDEPHIKLLDSIKSTENPGDLWTDTPSTEINPEINRNRLEGNSSPNSSVVTPVIQDRTIAPSGNPFLDVILSQVQSLLTDSDIVVSDVQHHQFQESFVFSRGPDVCRININYTGKQKISSVSLVQPSDFGTQVLARLSELKGVSPVVGGQDSGAEAIEFDEDFLNELHQRLLQVTSDNNIQISSVTEQQWSQRYEFCDRTGLAVIDIYYNGKKQFTRCNPVKSLCSSKELTKRALELITTGLD